MNDQAQAEQTAPAPAPALLAHRLCVHCNFLMVVEGEMITDCPICSQPMLMINAALYRLREGETL
jgi:hypothetical protein